MRVAGCIILFGIAGCTWEGPAPELSGQDVHLTFLHTADWHSRLLPYDFTVGQVDLGLGLVQENGPFGGAARMSYLLQRERARSGAVLHLDSGDVFQGAPIFNYFLGEAEMRALSLSGLDAAVIGNHEFDAGGDNFARQTDRWATFPVLAANYLFEPYDATHPEIPRLGRIAQPFTILNAHGLNVAVIGIGNLSSLTSIFEQPNRLGIVPIETFSVAQFYIDLLRPIVDVVVMLTHSGVNSDNRLVRNTSGIDVVLARPRHFVLNPTQVVTDCAHLDEAGRHYIEFDDAEDPGAPRVRRFCRPRPVVIAHSGAFMKYLGRLDMVLSNDPARVQPEPPADPDLLYRPELDGFEVLTHRFELFPVDSTVPEDPVVAEMLEPYTQQLDRLQDLDLLIGFAPGRVARFGVLSGDSPLGNSISEAMLFRLGIETDFVLTNTTGIRADLSPGPVSVEQIYNIFPFDNTVATMFLSGREVQEMFDFVARRSASRGCQSQAQIAGARVVLDCLGTDCPDGNACAPIIAIGTSDVECTRDEDCFEGRGRCEPSIDRCLLPLDPDASYEMATSNYLAGGGSGFRVLQRNTTTIDTQLPMRDVLIDFIRNGRPCGAVDGELATCTTDADCSAVRAGLTCACPERSDWDEAMGVCMAPDSCPGERGRCVLAQCAFEVAAFHQQRSCETAIDPIARARCECDAQANAYEECKFLACMDENLGADTDGRIEVRAF